MSVKKLFTGIPALLLCLVLLFACIFELIMFRHTILRHICYLMIVLALLLYWLYSGETEIPFVYNNF